MFKPAPVIVDEESVRFEYFYAILLAITIAFQLQYISQGLLLFSFFTFAEMT